MRRILKSYVTDKIDGAVRIPDLIIKKNPEIDDAIVYNESESAVYSDAEAEYEYEDIIDKANEKAAQIRRQMLSSTVDESKKIIDSALEEAELIKKNALSDAENIRENALAEKEKLFEQARLDGISTGIKEKSQDVEKIIANIQDCLDDLKKVHHLYMQDYAKELKWLSLEIAEKVISKKIDEDDLILAEIFKSVLKTVKDAKWITVQISDELPSLVEKIIKEIGGAECDSKIDVDTLMDADKGTCLIQLPDRVIDASVLTQLKNIEELFKEEDEVSNAKSQS